MRWCGACGPVPPPRSLPPPGKETPPPPPHARGVSGRSARKAQKCSTGAPLGTGLPPSARCCCRLVAEARHCSPGFARRLWPLLRAVGGRRMRGPREQHGGAKGVGVGVSGMGAKRDRRSAYWLWAGAAAAVAGEARERGSTEDSVVDSSWDVVDCVWLRFVWVAFGLILLAAWAKMDSWRLTGCGQELQWLKLERPEEGKAAEE
ncbi:uncharacterized protein LOC115346464 [Aquila chrysaetos chrysaetos]|uniref:uncharacterized protein LOC115346464 n=1 Tax=Aquila chrysaetos chrysaetos TaxID=223781 RepID=UPI0011772B11|nr:uncharacterized protein LOC115346464 [Aquila chrysaetos chrysaetos]